MRIPADHTPVGHRRRIRPSLRARQTKACYFAPIGKARQSIVLLLLRPKTQQQFSRSERIGNHHRDRRGDGARSSADSVATGVSRSFDQSGLPVNSSASHHTSPASSASRSVSDMVGRARRAQLTMGPVSQFRRNDMLNFRPMYSPMIMSRPLIVPSLGDSVAGRKADRGLDMNRYRVMRVRYFGPVDAFGSELANPFVTGS
jgi:hypothetical protein